MLKVNHVNKRVLGSRNAHLSPGSSGPLVKEMSLKNPPGVQERSPASWLIWATG